MVNSFIQHQLELKTLKKSNSNLNSIKLNINLFKVNSVQDIVILDSFCLLEFFSNTKPYINQYKKSYKQLDLQISTDLRVQNLEYFLTILKIFYLPILYRRNLKFSIDKITINTFVYSLKTLNFLPFVPDIYFKWQISLNCLFLFKKYTRIDILLFLEYLGLNFKK